MNVHNTTNRNYTSYDWNIDDIDNNTHTNTINTTIIYNIVSILAQKLYHYQQCTCCCYCYCYCHYFTSTTTLASTSSLCNQQSISTNIYSNKYNSSSRQQQQQQQQQQSSIRCKQKTIRQRSRCTMLFTSLFYTTFLISYLMICWYGDNYNSSVCYAFTIQQQQQQQQQQHLQNHQQQHKPSLFLTSSVSSSSFVSSSLSSRIVQQQQNNGRRQEQLTNSVKLFSSNNKKFNTDTKDVCVQNKQYFTFNYTIPPLMKHKLIDLNENLDTSLVMQSSSSSSVTSSKTKRKSTITNTNTNTGTVHQQHFYYDHYQYDHLLFDTTSSSSSSSSSSSNSYPSPSPSPLPITSNTMMEIGNTLHTNHDESVDTTENDNSDNTDNNSQWLPVTYTNDPKTVSQWIADNIHPNDSEHGCIVGFDVESAPSCYTNTVTGTGTSNHLNRNPFGSNKQPNKNNNNNNNETGPSVVQLSTTTNAIVIHLIHPNGKPNMACIPLILSVLCNDNIIKVGVSLDQDILELLEYYKTKTKVGTTTSSASSSVSKNTIFDVTMRFDLSRVREQKKGDTPGLRTLTASILGLDLPKPTSIATSNWNTVPLVKEQIYYSARDAWVSACILYKLQQIDSITFSTKTLQQTLPKQECSMYTLYQRHIRRKQAKFLLSTFFPNPKTITAVPVQGQGQVSRKYNNKSTIITTTTTPRMTTKSVTDSIPNGSKSKITSTGSKVNTINAMSIINPFDVFSLSFKRPNNKSSSSSSLVAASFASSSVQHTTTALSASVSSASSSSSSVTTSTELSDVEQQQQQQHSKELKKLRNEQKQQKILKNRFENDPTTMTDAGSINDIVSTNTKKTTVSSSSSSSSYQNNPTVMTGWKAAIVRELKQILNTNIHDKPDIFDIRQLGLKLVSMDPKPKYSKRPKQQRQQQQQQQLYGVNHRLAYNTTA